MSQLVVRIILGLGSLGAVFAHGGQDSNLPVIGQILFTTPSNAAPWDKAFRSGLHDLGYIEGKNVTIVARYANGDASRVPALIQEMIALHVNVLWVAPVVVRDANKATETIPIVCPSMGDPVEEGLVASLARPGGNITGLSSQAPDSDPKRLELATELVPGLRRLGLLFESFPAEMAEVEAFRKLAHSAGIETLHTFKARNLAEIEAALKAINKEQLQALIVWNSPLLGLHRALILRSTAHRLPVVADGREFAEAGALTSYAPNSYDLYMRSAAYVDKILRGAKPGDLPIEQPTKFELIVNLRAAKALGIVVPDSIVRRADEIIR